ncbi:CBS domain-containing protein [Cupriavidus nantongensis]|uniref:CBS domain-containing protein n=1 Tax=Cupriavidus nantongensis TaxID=1796606 RepID=A0A142JV26_9BURK|nr:CBS domain-containing protein [Cupriavidus nantongensis]AMR81938.1 CBS domain-containing protein [Cupriavidus nantongensis]
MFQSPATQPRAPRRVVDIMTRQPAYITPDETIQHAAQLMADLHVGSLPVCDGRRLVGMLTDRDITVRATAGGQPPQATRVADAMSPQVQWCLEDESLEDAQHKMEAAQVRRLPVLDHDHTLVGIVSLGDFASKGADARESGETLASISTPSAPAR